MTTLTTDSHHQAAPARVVRIEIHPGSAHELDPPAATILKQAGPLLPGLRRVHTARIFLIEAMLDDEQTQRIAEELLCDPITQQVHVGARPVAEQAAMIEVHYQPGVMDPVAQSTRSAIAEMLPDLDEAQIQVRTGFRFDFHFDHPLPEHIHAQLRQFAERQLANPVIQDIHSQPYHPQAFEHGHAYHFHLTHVPLRELDDEGLKKLSREGHLFLSLDEMRAIRDYYRDINREPTDIELETLAQTWSEHCVHKTLKSTIHYQPATTPHAEHSEASDQPAQHAPAIFHNKPGHTLHEDGSVTIDNLLKSTVAAATHKLMETQPHRDWCVSVFEDNAGIVRFDDNFGICIKVETHNHPSAIEPYGGAATGIGGCIRDILGTGLAARPIANSDVFCVAYPDQTNDLPKGVIHPRRILEQVVAGVRDYGNRMGIPTINGMVYFHQDFLGNPLVFAGCVGLIPLDKCFGSAKPGDRIIALGGATGRDGIHGATFSSAELTDSHADEFSHAVQIGNPIEQKRMADVILRARDQADGPLFNAITDCGAGGFSSAIGEMGEKVGAYVELEKAPLKYAGLSYTEIWISEAQERMVLAVPTDKVAQLRELSRAEDVPFCDLGQFGWHSDGPGEGEPMLVLTYHGQQVGSMAMRLLHDGIPTPTRTAIRQSTTTNVPPSNDAASASDGNATSLESTLLALLAHPNIASKHWIIRQYDHEVQGGSVIKPLVGPQQDGPSDGAVIRPLLDSSRGVVLACGMAANLSENANKHGLAIDGDSYWATLAAMDEAVRNAVCVGADPRRIAILDNFCWPGCDDPHQLATLVHAAEACYDGALAYQTPFVSGKDSLNNQFTTEDGSVITIPQTLLITAMGICDDITLCRTMDAKQAGHALLIIGTTTAGMGGSHERMVAQHNSEHAAVDQRIPRVDLATGPANARAVAMLIQKRLVASAHDCSDGGLLVAAAEMAFAGRVGLDLDLTALPTSQPLDLCTACFAETPSRYLLEVEPDKLDPVIRHLRDAGIAFGQIGTFTSHQQLTLRDDVHGRQLDIPLDQLRQAWLQPLDW